MNEELLEQTQQARRYLAEAWKAMVRQPNIEGQVVKNLNLGYTLEVPFDVQSCLAISATPFGYLGTGDLIGKYVRIKNSENIVMDFADLDMTLLTEFRELVDNIPMNGAIGRIVGDVYSRVLVFTPQGYYGWIGEDQYELIHIHNPFISSEDEDIIAIQ